MQGRLGVYYSWSWPQEAGASLGVIENRFPTLFETRRILYPRYSELADPAGYDQGIGGFLDHILRRNFVTFVETAGAALGDPAVELQRTDADGVFTPIDPEFVSGLNTLLIISFDSLRTGQVAGPDELAALREFLATPGNLLIVSPHHDLGDAPEAEFYHHGDRTLPPEQRFGGFARSVLSGLGVPVENRYGLHPATEPDGSPAPLVIDHDLDRLGLLAGVTTFNAHPHLPNLERIDDARSALDVVAQQRIDLAAPPHPFTANGRSTFDALLQSRPGIFAGDLVVTDATLWSSTAGGLDSLKQLWLNVLGRHK
jgi:hypothetical protein